MMSRTGRRQREDMSDATLATRVQSAIEQEYHPTGEPGFKADEASYLARRAAGAVMSLLSKGVSHGCFAEGVLDAARALLDHDASGADGVGTCENCADLDGPMCEAMGVLWRDLRQAVLAADSARMDSQIF
jgi:hypothetical protein